MKKALTEWLFNNTLKLEQNYFYFQMHFLDKICVYFVSNQHWSQFLGINNWHQCKQWLGTQLATSHHLNKVRWHVQYFICITRPQLIMMSENIIFWVTFRQCSKCQSQKYITYLNFTPLNQKMAVKTVWETFWMLRVFPLTRWHQDITVLWSLEYDKPGLIYMIVSCGICSSHNLNQRLYLQSRPCEVLKLQNIGLDYCNHFEIWHVTQQHCC